MNKPRIGIVLSGCGFLDGAEIQEAVLTMLAVDKNGGEMIMMAPYTDQYHIIDHSTGNVLPDKKRQVHIEAARIARGLVKDLKYVKAGDLDALVLPGGYGAAKNLSDFAFKAEGMSVNPNLVHLINDMYSAGKPIGFICIAPVIGAKVLGSKGIKITIGNDPSTAKVIESLGAIHVNCGTNEFVADEANKVVSTPAYMLGPNIASVEEGISKLVSKVIDLIPK